MSAEDSANANNSIDAAAAAGMAMSLATTELEYRVELLNKCEHKTRV